jgi:hypothetical protein
MGENAQKSAGDSIVEMVGQRPIESVAALRHIAIGRPLTPCCWDGLETKRT